MGFPVPADRVGGLGAEETSSLKGIPEVGSAVGLSIKTVAGSVWILPDDVFRGG